jgi:hypothetical protein
MNKHEVSMPLIPMVVDPGSRSFTSLRGETQNIKIQIIDLSEEVLCH